MRRIETHRWLVGTVCEYPRVIATEPSGQAEHPASHLKPDASVAVR